MCTSEQGHDCAAFRPKAANAGTVCLFLLICIQQGTPSLPPGLLPVVGQVQVVQLEGAAVAAGGIFLRHIRRLHRPGVLEVCVHGRAVPLRLPVSRHLNLRQERRVRIPPAAVLRQLFGMFFASRFAEAPQPQARTSPQPLSSKSDLANSCGTAAGLSNSRNAQSLPFSGVMRMPDCAPRCCENQAAAVSGDVCDRSGTCVLRLFMPNTVGFSQSGAPTCADCMVVVAIASASAF